MEQLHGFPYFRLEFNKNGKPVDPGQMKAITVFLASDTGTTDFVFFSHGWNNNTAEAHDLYNRFFGNVRIQWGNTGMEAAGRKLAVVGIFWPSKKFTDAELIPGGAAGIETLSATDLVSEALTRWARSEDDPAWRDALLKSLADLPRLARDESLQDAWVARLLNLLPAADADTLEGLTRIRDMRGRDILRALAPPVFVAPVNSPNPTPGALSVSDSTSLGDSGFGAFLPGISGGAGKFLNLLTYYSMKERAGMIGGTGARDAVLAVQAARPNLKIHLVGHSFGARLVPAILKATPAPKIQTLAMLQGAFSHYGFSDTVPEIGNQPGFFRDLISGARIAGPALATHTINDTAVGLAYALASRFAGTIASSVVGGPEDPYGGIGRNGARRTPEAVSETLQPAGAPYSFQNGRIHNLNGDKVITGHSDVTRPEVTWAWLQLIAG